ncbi:glycerophosphodiester phosphodiesterase [Eubacteriales bacterium OttesenSCG-928-A19]|nr:glycerophosphodiester phosphodiesterase [Eubacteriales bacterium OttesenSCG-928-A19]
MTIHPRMLDKDVRLVVGHRGMKSVYPENTLLSFEKAIELGVDGLEMDVNVSRDGDLIVMHDLTVDRTTNGTGRIRDLTTAELKKLDAGSHLDARFAGLQVPLFDEFCQLMARHRDVLLNVEIKDKTEECVDKTVAMLDSYGLLPSCIFTCFDANIVKYIHLRHDLPTQGFCGFVMQNFEPGLRGTFSHMAAVGLEMKLLTPERVTDYAEMGILPWAYCPDDERSAAYSRYCGAWLVTSNNPEPCLRVFRDA